MVPGSLQTGFATHPQSACLVCSSQVAFTLGGFALGALGCPSPMASSEAARTRHQSRPGSRGRSLWVPQSGCVLRPPPRVPPSGEGPRSGSGKARKVPGLVKQHGSGFEAQAPQGQSRRAPPEYTVPGQLSAFPPPRVQEGGTGPQAQV